MAWEDDDPEEENGPLAIARALAGSNDEKSEEDTAPQSTPSSKNAPTADTQDPALDMLSPQSMSSPDEQGPVGMQQPEQPSQPVQSADDDQSLIESQFALPTSQAKMTAPTLPTTPTYRDPGADENSLEQSMANFKPSDYKPSGWRRALAGVGGALTAFGGDREGGRQEVRDIEGKPLARAQADLQQEQTATRQRIADTNAANARSQQEYKDATTQYGLNERDIRNQGYVDEQNARAENQRAQAQARRNAITQFTPTDPNNPYAGGTGVTADGRTVKGVAPPDKWIQSWARSPQGQNAIQNMNTQRRGALAKQLGMKPGTEDFNELMVNGKISRPPRTTVHVPSAELSKYTDWKTQFQKDNGRPPNAAEIASFGHVTNGRMSQSLNDKILKDKQTQLDTATQQFQAGGGKNPDQYEQDLQDAQDRFEQRVEDASGEAVPHVTVKVGPDGNPQFIDPAGSVMPATSGQQAPPQGRPTQQPAVRPVAAAQPPAANLPPPTQARFNVQKWTAANPKGNVQQAIAAARAKGYAIVGAPQGQ